MRPTTGLRWVSAWPTCRAAPTPWMGARSAFAHLAVMARTADAVGKGFEEAKLLPLAREHSPGKFHYKCLHYRHSVDAKKYAEEQSEQQFSHHLSLSTADSGHLLITGVLDPV